MPPGKVHAYDDIEQKVFTREFIKTEEVEETIEVMASFIVIYTSSTKINQMYL